VSGPAVFVVGATNRLDGIDPAILSRFVEQIEIGLPDQGARQQLLNVFLGDVACKANPKDIAQVLSTFTDNYSGRDLQKLCSKATLRAVKHCGNNGAEFKIGMEDFIDALPHLQSTRQTKPVENGLALSQDDSESIYPI
jgi:SpoVK/Ycf46/Vps4 family AAA+-type ATPase